MIRLLSLALTLPLLAACGTVGRDLDYVTTDYKGVEGTEITVEAADGPTTFVARLHPRSDKVLVMLATGTLKRAMAKDMGQSSALPQSVFQEAANRRLTEAKGPDCATTTGLPRQDYLWEFDFVCGSPAEREKKRKVAAKCGGDISCEYRQERAATQEERCKKLGGVSVGMTAEQVHKSCWGKPKSINATVTGSGRREQWVYGGGYLYFEGGRLTTIQTRE